MVCFKAAKEYDLESTLKILDYFENLDAAELWSLAHASPEIAWSPVSIDGTFFKEKLKIMSIVR